MAAQITMDDARSSLLEAGEPLVIAIYEQAEETGFDIAVNEAKAGRNRE